MALASAYNTIASKIGAMKQAYPLLRNKPDAYVFSALCIKASLFKNPALTLNENDFIDYIVDGKYDGGVDILLNDPNSDASDLIIGQSKFYSSITSEDILNALLKMALFYKDMLKGHYETVSQRVQRKFLTLNAEIGEESKIHFILYTSAPQNGIRRDRIEKKFKDQFSNQDNIEVTVLFGNDIVEEVKESESRRPTVESGKLHIDCANNVLFYGEDAAMVNVSAFSIKALYAQHNNNLLARNLRYHIAGRDIDKGIADTIRNTPEQFWMMNNGITIICDDFKVDGKDVHLWNFSIINGGQTTYALHKSHDINEAHDLFLPCKIIRAIGTSEDDKNTFSLAIAKATNSQKAIKPVDLKANSPEQIRFSQAMREVGLFYQTKRGEQVPKAFKDVYKNSSLAEIGKLCLAGIFQAPCLSRSKPSSLYLPQYYEKIFNGNQHQVALLCKDLLYIDYYFRTFFTKRFDKERATYPNANELISFAHNARTICIAFAAFASRYVQGNITNECLNLIANSAQHENSTNSDLYDCFSNLENIQHFIPLKMLSDKDTCDSFLYELFLAIIDAGSINFSIARNCDASINATNFLKKDKNYYSIISLQWATLKNKIDTIFKNYT